MSSRPRSTRVPLADRVYDQLFEELISGKRAPGETLNIATLVDELDVSQTPIREALARLENTGLVRRFALRGYEVTPLLSREQIAELIEARLLLEPEFARIAAGRATPAFLEKLRVTIDLMTEEGAEHGDHGLTGALSADESFHLLISSQTGNAYLNRAYRSLRAHVQRFRLLSGTAAAHARVAAMEHEEIYRAFEVGDADDAAAAMRRHLENVDLRMRADYAALERGESAPTA